MPLPSVYPTSQAEVYASFKSYPVEVVAGTGDKGFQDGPALKANFTEPRKPCVDPRDGSLYIPDSSLLRKLTPAGQIVTVAGSPTRGFKDGSIAEARFQSLKGCVVDNQGNVLVIDTENFRIRELSADGKSVTTFLGTGQPFHQDGDKNQASFSILLNDLTFGSTSQLYIRDGYWLEVFQNGKLRTLNPHQKYETNNSNLGASDGNIAAKGKHALRGWMAIDKADNFLLADESTRTLRRIDNQGNLKTLYNSEAKAGDTYGPYYLFHYFYLPTGVTFDAFRNKFYVASISMIYEVDLLGNANLIAGNFPQSPSEKNLFSVNDSSMVVSTDRNLYIADTNAHQIKRVILPPP